MKLKNLTVGLLFTLGISGLGLAGEQTQSGSYFIAGKLRVGPDSDSATEPNWNGTNLNDDSIGGLYSVAMGYSAYSLGDYSYALGYNAKSAAAHSFAFGRDSETLTGTSYSYALGRAAKAYQSYSVAIGYNSKVDLLAGTTGSQGGIAIGPSCRGHRLFLGGQRKLFRRFGRQHSIALVWNPGLRTVQRPSRHPSDPVLDHH